MYTASFSEARKNLTEIADRVATDGVEYTIFKRSKPLFKIVPVRDAPAGEPVATVAKSLTRREAAERAAARADRARTPKNWADLKAAAAAEAGAPGAAASAAAAVAEEVPASDSARPRIPDGGQELFEYAMQLRARMPRNSFLSTLTPEGLKRELANRDV